MEQTANLKLPYIMPSQAQKHVTHNEAIRLLDGLVQLAVRDRDLSAPPVSPEEGECHIVAAAATGAWTGWEGQVAYFADGAWMRFAPAAGWRAWIVDEARLAAFDGVGWQAINGFPESAAEIQNAALFGLGTTADATNPFSAKLDKALWTARYTAEGGTGSLLYTMNKEAAAGDVGFLLQSGFVTRAMFGLLGSDGWRLAVSPDGLAFKDAIRTDEGSGLVALPGNAKFLGFINYDQYVAADTWQTVAINNTLSNDQMSFDTGANRFTAPADGLYRFGASIGWKQNGANVPTAVKAKLVLNGVSDLCAPLVAGDVADLAVDGSETALHLHVMARLAVGDTVALAQLFSGLDGYVPATVTRFWGEWVA
ncbi:DUF2793 domain-containing protein [Nitratireductor aquimarinus]|uniref:DUF2793 domain-containing protein n=1 Tax=Nitratireductor TaxID=245876 RepID=UPI0019D3B949|nr:MULTISPECIES: DUF2793 domain-containing protein [Nitratireductor]MBN7777607.1 DUF2793 domain-containing protein [Nitratireductor pacificus]MBN7781600.1 DUF2793 domain-containing protein [Nitratireductor pacificus]MBN7790406.1 DUF2793 domain-containing protein [Nitratireductor aquimarinus]MBY6099816.1 DUF2793 domain-containing protein [Nitratireductor aquimarinus]MCA1261496.1 DUF2793 domain-containing protein [Nitratireductor aquimarinus]